MDIINEDLNKIKNFITDYIVDPIPNNVLKNFVSSNSKFIRSKLAILYLKSQNIEITENIIRIISSGEITHNASLLHDDVIDNAEQRRGISTIAKEYSSKISILAGDYLISTEIEILLELEDFKIIKSFKNCIKKMTEAEFKQYFLRNKFPSKKEYIEICKNKTASLFSTILECCAIHSNIDTQKAKNFGELFGTCFQIRNDLDLNSAKLDQLNGIHTAYDILGIEKTTALLDNYKEKMSNMLKDLPVSIYKEGLEDLINLL